MCFVTTGFQNGDADIFSIHSEDAGTTWSSIHRLNDDAVANGKGQDMVWAAYNEQGTIATCWRDRRNASATGFWNAEYQFYYSLSTDNGAHFTTNKIIHQPLIPFDSLIAENGNDVMGCVYHQDTLYTVWGDTRNGKMNIYFNKLIASSNSSIGFSSLNDETHWTIYPNPVEGQLHLVAQADLIGKNWQIIKSDGELEKIDVLRNEKQTIDLNELHPGAYFLLLGEELKQFIIK
jgi:hypothetical protein